MRLSPNNPWRELKYALWFPLYLLIFSMVETFNTTNYWATQLPIDQHIPFISGFIVFYSLWYPMLIAVGLYLLLRDQAGFRRYMYFLALSFFLSILIWILIPNGQDLRPIILPQSSIFTPIFTFLYRIDTNTNVFPSVHVIGSLGAMFAVLCCERLRTKRLLRLGTVVLAGLICLSTVFVKQHSALDLVGGIVLAVALAAPLYGSRPTLRSQPHSQLRRPSSSKERI